MNYEDAWTMKDVPLCDLIDQIKDIEDKLQNLGEAHYLLYRQIIEEMEKDNATIARSEKHVAKLTPKVSYDSTILAKLREITDPEDLDGVYTPERQVVKVEAERWNMTKGRKLLKFGNEHQAIIEDAKIFGNPTLKVYLKGESG